MMGDRTDGLSMLFEGYSSQGTGYTESPCKKCSHHKAGEERKICRHFPDCLLGDIGPAISSNNEWRRKTTKQPLVKCAFPGCQKMTRSKTGFCVTCQNTIRYRKSKGWPEHLILSPKRESTK